MTKIIKYEEKDFIVPENAKYIAINKDGTVIVSAVKMHINYETSKWEKFFNIPESSCVIVGKMLVEETSFDDWEYSQVKIRTTDKLKNVVIQECISYYLHCPYCENYIQGSDKQVSKIIKNTKGYTTVWDDEVHETQARDEASIIVCDECRNEFAIEGIYHE